MNILEDFPLMVPDKAGSCSYSGFIDVKDQLYGVEIELWKPGDLPSAEVRCDWELQQILGDFSSIIKQRLQQCGSVHSFLKELSSIAERQLEGRSERSVGSASLCRQLLEDIEQLGWDKIAHVDDNFQELHLQFKDQANRSHLLKIYISNQYPGDVPNYSVQLPAKFDLHWSTTDSLVHAYRQFTSAVDSYKAFWDVMDEIDAKTWVLEPDSPSSAATHRRIAINTGVSVQISIDPSNPHALPDIKLLGSDQSIAPMRQSMNAKTPLWDERKGLLENLQTVLDITFPSPSNTAKEEFSVECGICYAYNLESEIPDETCNDPRCRQAFHRSCLVEWLRALSTSRQSFNTIFGNCPYCEKPMTVKMVSS